MGKKMKIPLGTTQRRVYEYMEKFGSITSLQAFVDLGETRLSARIYELKDKGVDISARYISVRNRFGESRRVKEYRIG